MTKIPLRLQAFLHGAPKSQNSAILTDFMRKMHFLAPKRKKKHFRLQNAPWAPRASLITRQSRRKLKSRKVDF